MSKTMDNITSNTTDTQFDYTGSSKTLEEIVAKLESGSVPIDEAMLLHKQGQKLADDIAAYLEQVGSEIRIQANK